MISNQAGLIIHRPIDQVFAFVAQLENRPKWCAGTVATQQTSTGSVGSGTTFHEVFELFLGRKGEADYTITVYEPNKRLAFMSTSGPIRAAETLIFDVVDGGTRVTQMTEADFNRFKIIEPLFKGMGQRMLVANLTRLQAQLER